MARHKMKEGVCRLCGKEALLSYEHVPPRVAFNRNTKFVSVDFDEYLQARNVLKNPPKGKQKQGGIGYNSFCRDCNSYLGSNYVNAYRNWVVGGAQLLNKEKEHGLCSYTISNIEPLKVLKHIISMFLAINGEWFLESFPDLVSFVSDKDSTNLPERYRIFMYLTRAEKFRYMHYAVNGNFKTGIITNCSEIAFPPYGYVLTFDFEGRLNFLNEITNFKKFRVDDEGTLKMVTYQLPTYMPFSLDYRSESQIEDDIDKSEKQLEELKKNYDSREFKQAPKN